MRIGSFIITLCFVGSLHAQSFVKGFGFFGSGTSSKHEYTNTDTDKKTDTSALASYFYPQTHISKERLSWGAGVFVELGKEKLRWQTELSYINKGAKEMPFAAPGYFYTGDRTGTYQANKTTYIEWNNFLKFYYPLGGNAHWYVMPGIRLEYLFKQVTPVFSDFAGAFPKFWFSGDLGLGYEFPIVRRFNGFIEGHWNPDVISHKQANTRIRSRTFELRAGIVIRPRKRRIDDCNAPRYRGPEF
jgi:hypothetical protein